LDAESRLIGFTSLFPCVHHSEVEATVERDMSSGQLQIRLGLTSVRGVGEAAQRIVSARKVGKFRDTADLVRRVGLSVAQLEALATAGALETFGLDRRAALWQSGAVATERADRLPGTSVGVEAPMLPGMDDFELDMADMWATGISPDSYPTQHRRQELTQRGVL